MNIINDLSLEEARKIEIESLKLLDRLLLRKYVQSG